MEKGDTCPADCNVRKAVHWLDVLQNVGVALVIAGVLKILEYESQDLGSLSPKEAGRKKTSVSFMKWEWVSLKRGFQTYFQILTVVMIYHTELAEDLEVHVEKKAAQFPEKASLGGPLDWLVSFGADLDQGMQQKKFHEKNMASGESTNVDAAASEAGGVSQATQSPTVSSHISPIMAIPAAAITAPSTTLNIGMDYWGGPSPASVNSFRSKLPITPCPAAVVSSRDAVPSDFSLQGEREIKRQKRKLSNRESARRSRLRKQAECEELALRASSLKEENDGLREELAKIKENCEKLASENASLTEKLKKLQGEEPRSHDTCEPESNS
ncbi:hypothetical protein Taro_052376 [Colocasia esculenta]|uniref:BZIP domain-containing protein n=1 Tax=Colocasia esculenta TaxID=4460 RepID=A0A843XJJ2_COLES|nr:hypothetical protein [Colocasia esculenta]